MFRGLQRDPPRTRVEIRDDYTSVPVRGVWQHRLHAGAGKPFRTKGATVDDERDLLKGGWLSSGLSRRTILRGGFLGGAGLAAAALVGCGDDDDDDDDDAATPTATATAAATATATATATAPAGTAAPTEQASSDGPRFLSPTGTDPATANKGGTFTTGYFSAPERMDPHQSTGGLFSNRVGEPFLERIHPDRTLRPWLIESWEIQDPATTILQVRQGVNFHNREPANGRDMEARDVAYSLNSIRGDVFPEAPAPRAGGFARVLSIEAMDTQTVKVAFSGPSSVFIAGALGDQRNTVIPEGIHEHFGDGQDSLHAAIPERHVGTGPFIPEVYLPNIAYTRNPDYWNSPYPLYDRQEHTITADRSTWVAAVLSGQFHTMDGLNDQEESLLRQGGDDMQFFAGEPAAGFYHVGLNIRRPGLNDVRLRQAMSLVFDRPALGEAILGSLDRWKFPGTLAYVFPEAIPQEELADRPHFRSPTEEDLAEARKLYAATGIEDTGLSITFNAPNFGGVHGFTTTTEFFADTMERNFPGFEVKLDIVGAYGDFLARLQALDFDAYCAGWTFEADGVLMMDVFYASDAGRGFSGYASDKMDQLLESAFAAVDDPEERTSIMREAQELALVDMPALPTHNFTTINAHRTEVRDLLYVGTNLPIKTYAWFDS